MLAPAVHFHAVTDIGGLIRDVLTTFGSDVDVQFSITPGGMRGAHRNAVIALVQAEAGRNPFYLSREQSANVCSQVAKIATGRGYNWRTVGHTILEAIKENADSQISANGRGFTRLTEAYAKRKAKKHGFVIPILKATGDLLNGLKVRIDQKRQR